MSCDTNCDYSNTRTVFKLRNLFITHRAIKYVSMFIYFFKNNLQIPIWMLNLNEYDWNRI